MPDEEHLKILKQGVEQWNKWRLENAIRPDLSGANLIGADLIGTDLIAAYLSFADLTGANLSGIKLIDANLIGANLSGANLIGANLIGANLSSAYLSGANLSGAYLSGAYLGGAYLSGANLRSANLRGANLSGAYLSGANLTSADLTDADLSGTRLVETDFTNATITGCRTYGASAWNVTLAGTVQHNLIITKKGEPVVSVDGLEVGQFIYLILNNTKIRNVIDTITSKGVLILGRFSDPQRKSVLEGLREGLRNFDLLPIAFDFDRPTDKDYTETVQTLAGMSMFVIADLTSPKSTSLELEATVKQFKIPYVPIIDISVDPRPFAMLVDSQKSFHWVLPTLKYESKEDLLDGENLKTHILEPAFAKREQLRAAKNQEPEAILIPKKKVTIPHDK
ncbi:MAG: pentapeptide repeat-containing protein [Candidatus Udaeobacter sp.]